MSYIETKLTYDKVCENGLVKRVTESYLVDALTFTEAEARIIEEMTPFISGDFTVGAVKKTKIGEIVANEHADRNYLVKVALITLDERTGVEKRTASLVLVQADGFDSAYKSFLDAWSNTVSDFEILSISETPILEVFYSDNSDEKVSD